MTGESGRVEQGLCIAVAAEFLPQCGKPTRVARQLERERFVFQQ